MGTGRDLHSRILVSHLPTPGGLWVFVWKGWMQAWRRLDARGVISWMALLGLSIGLMLARGWVTLIWVFILWALLIGQVCPKRFISDLGLWSIFRQLPFSGQRILLADIANPVIGATGLTWLAYGICSMIGWQTNLTVAILAPGVILSLTLTAVFDILRLSKTDALLAGFPAHMGAVGLYLGLLLAGLPVILVSWLVSLYPAPGTALLFSLLGLALSACIAYFLWGLAASRYKAMS